jgi:hypothetical protein
VKRIDYIQDMTVEEMANKIVQANFTDEYCKSNCEEDDCPHEIECCVRWLESELGGGHG